MSSVWVGYGMVSAVGVLVIAGIVVGAVFLWRGELRRSVIALVARREAIRAAYRGLEAVFEALSSETPEAVARFATDPACVQRKALEELQARMAIQVEELRAVALPKRFWATADLLQTAAEVLRDQVARMNLAPTPEAVLDAVAKIDVAAVRAAITSAGEELDRQLAVVGVDEPAVYGGGLYI